MAKPATDYEIVIGLEVHVQMLTRTKMFCGCSTKFGESPNTQACPVCTGMPGVLPVINHKALELAIRAGLATHCRIAPFSRFARKNYFYPDLPKGYQVSQFEHPLCVGGYLNIPDNGVPRKIRIQRIHMEEDAGKNIHEGVAATSHVDLNRAGVPLLEAVSEPDLGSPEEAVAYLKAFRNLLVYLGVSDGNMEEGSLRCDANVSLRPRGQKELGTRTELKNINSFRFVQKALEFEIERHAGVLRAGGKIVQETRLWDSANHVTSVMRTKEEAHDYRYFPEPDLVPLEISQEWTDEIRSHLPELPDAKRERFVEAYGIPPYDAEVLTAEKAMADYFEQCAGEYKNYRVLSGWILSESLRAVKEGGNIASLSPPDHLARLLTMMDEGSINRTIAKKVYEEMCQGGMAPDEIVQKQGLAQVSDEASIDRLIDEVLEAHLAEVQAYRQGKEKLFGFFVGQVMKRSKGKANPARVNDQLREKLRSP